MAHIYKERVVINQSVPHSDEGAWSVIRIVNYILAVVEALLTARFLLLLFGANPGNGFVSAVYQVSKPLMAPFQDIFRSTSSNGVVFDWSILVAMVVCAVIAYFVSRLIEGSITDADI